MKYILLSAKLSINHNETWLTYIPLNDFIKLEDLKGFNLLSLQRKRISKNIIKDLSIDWFGNPINLYFKKVNNVQVISKLKNGDKELK